MVNNTEMQERNLGNDNGSYEHHGHHHYPPQEEWSENHPPTGGQIFEGEVESAKGEKERIHAEVQGGVQEHPPTGADVVAVDIQDEEVDGPAPEEEDEDDEEEYEYTFLGKIRHKLRNFLGEFLGTMLLIVMGDGVVAQTTLSNGTAGSQLGINFGWAMAVFIAVYVVGGISGAHLNPAVTLAFAVFRKFPWKQLPVYWAGQLVGAFTGAAIVYGNYKDSFDFYFAEKGVGKDVLGDFPTAGIFATYPQAFLSTTSQFFDQVLGTAVLILVIFGSSDKNNMSAGKNGPLVVAFTVLGIGISLGWQTGYAINPARDLGPRLLSYAVGYGRNTFRAFDNYSWIPVIGTFSGAVVGGLMYHFLIDSPTNHWWMYKKEGKKRKEKNSPKISPKSRREMEEPLQPKEMENKRPNAIPSASERNY